MPSEPGAASVPARRFLVCGQRLLWALTLMLAAGATAAAHGAERSAEAALFDRLCAHTLRPNEEDRLYGMISLTVRTTIRYAGGVFSPDLIDDAVQNALGAMLDACPRISATADAERLGMVVDLIREATIKRLDDRKATYSAKQVSKASAADLSEELSSREIDAWLDALPARQRALALFLYASHLTHGQIAHTVGLPPATLPAAFRGIKADLLKFYRADWSDAPPPPIPPDRAVDGDQAGQDFAALLGHDETAAATVRVSGISSELYAGWSLLATVTGLPADRRLDLRAPILLDPDEPGHQRMIAVALDEMSDPHDAVRRFLVRAFAIDAEKDGAGLRDTFHLGAAAIDNAAAQRTLRNTSLSSIEIARCLWHDYGTAADPGLCR